MRKKASNDLISLASVEHRNVEKTVQRLEELLAVFDALLFTASTLFPLVQEVLLKKDNHLQYVAITNLYSLMMQDTLKGMVNFAKGYVTDASFQSRRVLEAAALAIEMYKKPKKVKFYTSFETEKDREKYIDNFKVFIIIQNTLSLEAQADYARLCFSVHPSALAIGNRALMSEQFEHSFELVEYPEDKDTPKLKMHFLIFVLTIFHGFRDLVKELEKNSDFNCVKAEIILGDFMTVWNDHRIEFVKEHSAYLEKL